MKRYRRGANRTGMAYGRIGSCQSRPLAERWVANTLAKGFFI